MAPKRKKNKSPEKLISTFPFIVLICNKKARNDKVKTISRPDFNGQ